MSTINLKSSNGYDNLLKKYAAEVITVTISRNYRSYVNVLKDTLNVKNVVELIGGRGYSWTPEITGLEFIEDTVGNAYVFRATGVGTPYIMYSDELGEEHTANIKTGNTIVCVYKGESFEYSKWILVTDEDAIVNVDDKQALFTWGTTLTLATVQGSDITLQTPANPASGDIAQATFNNTDIVEDVISSNKKKIRVPEVFVKTTNTASSGDNRGFYVKYWDAAGVEQSDTIANITDLQAVFGISDIQDDVNAIKSKIPAQASSSNQLADKNFMNSSIATATAAFMGSLNLYVHLRLDPDDATHSDIAAALDDYSFDYTPDNNDYCFVEWPEDTTHTTQITQVERYKFNGSNWAYEYTLNNSGMTAAQLAATLSGITAEKVSKIADKPASPTNGQLVKFDSEGNLDNSGIPATSVIQNAAVASNPTVQKVKVMTSAEYYALTTLDANTEYIII